MQKFTYENFKKYKKIKKFTTDFFEWLNSYTISFHSDISNKFEMFQTFLKIENLVDFQHML